MRGSILVVLSLLLSPALALADHAMAPMTPTSGAPARMIEGLSDLHHPVTTTHAEAQQFFDQGLRLVFAFNHDEAIRSFRRAAELDPALAMAHWGIAYALGPNINLPLDEVRAQQALDAVRRASQLTSGASEPERDYIRALEKRYSADPKLDRATLDRAYRDAMRELHRRYPDDLDAAVLYAESMLDLTPWAWWSKDGKPAEFTEETIAVLESVLRRNPDHMGAIHYYIHVVESSPTPERALGYAERLPKLTPGAGHLVHMPTHLQLNLGHYRAAAEGNVVAAKVDRDYITREQITGVYPAMYFNHNLHLGAVASAMEGRYADAIGPARELERNVKPQLAAMPGIEFYLPTPLLLEIRFRRWNGVMASPRPDGAPATLALWHFGRGMAAAARNDLAGADRALGAFTQAAAKVGSDLFWGLNLSVAMLPIPKALLEARIARLRKDGAGAIAALQRAVAAEDALAYNEPPDWYLFARESLGGELLLQQKFAEAEAVFREETKRRPASGRALFGLHEALLGQNRKSAAGMVKVELDRAWGRSDVALAVADL